MGRHTEHGQSVFHGEECSVRAAGGSPGLPSVGGRLGLRATCLRVLAHSGEAGPLLALSPASGAVSPEQPGRCTRGTIG
jgi:hypothetical protein